MNEEDALIELLAQIWADHVLGTHTELRNN